MSERLGWTCTVLVSTFVLGTVVWKVSSSRSEDNWVGHALARFRQKPRPTGSAAGNGAVLPCITARRSIFARHFIDRRIDASVVQTLLEAAMWAPFHGPVPPWRFVVLGRESMVEMQKLTLEFYEANWHDVFSGDDERYRKLRVKLERAATEKWGPVSFMIAIVMQRQAGSKRMPEWEEMSATAAAVQNMHIQLVQLLALPATGPHGNRMLVTLLK